MKTSSALRLRRLARTDSLTPVLVSEQNSGANGFHPSLSNELQDKEGSKFQAYEGKWHPTSTNSHLSSGFVKQA